jgi:hypothetical protein
MISLGGGYARDVGIRYSWVQCLFSSVPPVPGWKTQSFFPNQFIEYKKFWEPEPSLGGKIRIVWWHPLEAQAIIFLFFLWKRDCSGTGDGWRNRRDGRSRQGKRNVGTRVKSGLVRGTSTTRREEEVFSLRNRLYGASEVREREAAMWLMMR